MKRKMFEKRLFRFVLTGFNVDTFWNSIADDDEVHDVCDLYETEALEHNESDRYIRYMGTCTALDKHKLWVVDIDMIRNIHITNTSERRCNHCHHTFRGSPHGCPVRYINLREDTNNTRAIVENLRARNISIDLTDEIFISKKIFCSPECTLAWIHEMRKRDLAYDKSLSLFMNYIDLLRSKYNIDLGDIKPAPPHEALKAYGGHLDIEEFRDVNGRLEYTVNKSNIPPLFFPVGEILEEMNGNMYRTK